MIQKIYRRQLFRFVIDRSSITNIDVIMIDLTSSLTTTTCPKSLSNIFLKRQLLNIFRCSTFSKKLTFIKFIDVNFLITIDFIFRHVKMSSTSVWMFLKWCRARHHCSNFIQSSTLTESGWAKFIQPCPSIIEMVSSDCATIISIDMLSRWGKRPVSIEVSPQR